MFGIVRPCSHRLTEGLREEWLAHLCGLCLALRADHGQFARIATNYDGLIVSVLTEAQTERTPAARRTAGPCPLRAMRTAPVARGEGARLAAAVSLVLASAKMRDHVADRDGLLARRPVAAAARRVARRWDAAGARTGRELGFDTAVLLDAVDRQAGVEALAGPGTPLLAVTEPTETATAAAFAHTAVLAGRPGNAAPLAEAGRLFGRLAHLLDAVEDLAADTGAGAWNPLTATGTSLAEARRLADDAVHGVRLALRDAAFVDDRLVHRLLAHELRRSVDRAFATTGCAHRGHGAPGAPRPPHGSGNPYGGGAGGQGPYGAPNAHGGGQPYAGLPGGQPGGYGEGPVGHGGQPGGGYGGHGGHGGHGGRGGGFGGGAGGPMKKPPRGLLAGCAVFTGLFCTCQICCAKEYEGPWSRKKREGCCRDCGNCDCGCDCCCPCDGC
ncbi:MULTISPECIES: DUF5685 family protein [Streptomyces]|uniref:Regulatory protein n=1 Tax=Streptomyces fradiae ATCC 10745 = DSM 40063 TaxID=1319510 RepID=A0ABQ6XX66_STRFR|nr:MULTISPECIES: DUF5685 family protein [Streptomyces]KAF0646534.1 regulatory protein [Streptomyces fradiae ATCC 10745 = DSM 40063]KAF0650349.1 regulatory protein [Streptomyces fradiae ATCC 10745 = DSM 40063]QEV11485.1 hypothetical protein CP974_05035 [Streptomyces fradiae ATCC 10745 = DSM 40063]